MSQHHPRRAVAALATCGLVVGLAAALAPAASASVQASVTAGDECGLPVFLGDVEGDGSGTVRIGTERGGCAEIVVVACEEGVLVVRHTPAATDETTEEKA